MKRYIVLLVALTLLAVPAGLALGQEEKSATPLPLTTVVLFSSGVGYFERSGNVEAGSRVELSFKTEDINDILKSLVVVGAQEASVAYASQDPVSKALTSFAVDITGNPTLGQLLDQLRGARVRVAMPQEFEGTILGVETHTVRVGPEETTSVDVLNVTTEDGLRSVELPRVVSLKLLDPGLDKELGRALAVLAAARDKNKKPVTITFGGKGTQEVALGYIVATPVWKTSYRLVLGEKERPLLQGWAIVENTTDDDWKGVHLSLVSGQPISFIQDLYTPLYATRPVVQPELFSGLVPQAYEGEMRMGLPEGGTGYAAAKPEAPAAVAPERAKAQAGEQSARGRAEAADRAGLAVRKAANGLALGDMQAAVRGAGAVAELFEYPIAGVIDLQRQMSAMFLIVNTHVKVERLSIYDENVQPKFPLAGLELDNTTGLYLMQGPIMVYDGGTYAGDARLTDLPAGDKRLISYAIDQKREVAVTSKSKPTELVSLKVVRGVLVIKHKYQRERTYTLANKEDKDRVVLVQYPFNPEWKLVAPADTKPATADLYRFRVTVPAKSSGKDGAAQLNVAEEQTVDQRVALLSETPDSIAIYLKSDKAGEALKDSLQKIITQKNAIADLKRDMEQKRQTIADIDRDQARIRENMKGLDKTQPLYATYIEKLTTQEKQLETLRTDIDKLQKDLDAAEKTLADSLQQLNVD